MNPAAIAVRAIFTYAALLVLVRMSGKVAVRNASTFDFVVALIVGDMVDDAIWAEVGAMQFVAGACSLFATHWAAKFLVYRQ